LAQDKSEAESAMVLLTRSIFVVDILFIECAAG
jgi:hypothetical protein